MRGVFISISNLLDINGVDKILKTIAIQFFNSTNYSIISKSLLKTETKTQY